MGFFPIVSMLNMDTNYKRGWIVVKGVLELFAEFLNLNQKQNESKDKVNRDERF